MADQFVCDVSQNYITSLNLHFVCFVISHLLISREFVCYYLLQTLPSFRFLSTLFPSWTWSSADFFCFQACPVRKMIIEQLQSVPPICGGMVQNLFWNFTHFLWFSIYKYFQFNFPKFQGAIWMIFSQGCQTLPE